MVLSLSFSLLLAVLLDDVDCVLFVIVLMFAVGGIQVNRYDKICTNIKKYALTIVFFGELVLRLKKPVCKISAGGAWTMGGGGAVMECTVVLLAVHLVCSIKRYSYISGTNIGHSRS
jgi:hypothetical protein